MASILNTIQVGKENFRFYSFVVHGLEKAVASRAICPARSSLLVCTKYVEHERRNDTTLFRRTPECQPRAPSLRAQRNKNKLPIRGARNSSSDRPRLDRSPTLTLPDLPLQLSVGLQELVVLFLHSHKRRLVVLQRLASDGLSHGRLVLGFI